MQILDFRDKEGNRHCIYTKWKTFPGKNIIIQVIIALELDTIIVSHKNIFYSWSDERATKINEYKQQKTNIRLHYGICHSLREGETR